MLIVVRAIQRQRTPDTPTDPRPAGRLVGRATRAAFPDLALHGSGNRGADRGVAGAECGAVGTDLHQPDAAPGFERPG